MYHDYFLLDVYGSDHTYPTFNIPTSTKELKFSMPCQSKKPQNFYLLFCHPCSHIHHFGAKHLYVLKYFVLQIFVMNTSTYNSVIFDNIEGTKRLKGNSCCLPLRDSVL